MASIAKSDFNTRFYSPQISNTNNTRLRRFQNLQAPNGFSIAYGMLLYVLNRDFLSLDEIQKDYNSYLKKFYSYYYIVPEFGPFCSLERKLEIFVKYGYVKTNDGNQGVKQYKLSEKGSAILGTYLLDSDLRKLLEE